jgi:hypothetical protein
VPTNRIDDSPDWLITELARGMERYRDAQDSRHGPERIGWNVLLDTEPAMEQWRAEMTEDTVIISSQAPAKTPQHRGHELLVQPGAGFAVRGHDLVALQMLLHAVSRHPHYHEWRAAAGEPATTGALLCQVDGWTRIQATVACSRAAERDRYVPAATVTLEFAAVSGVRAALSQHLADRGIVTAL